MLEAALKQSIKASHPLVLGAENAEDFTVRKLSHHRFVPDKMMNQMKGEYQEKRESFADTQEQERDGARGMEIESDVEEEEEEIDVNRAQDKEIESDAEEAIDRGTAPTIKNVVQEPVEADINDDAAIEEADITEQGEKAVEEHVDAKDMEEGTIEPIIGAEVAVVEEEAFEEEAVIEEPTIDAEDMEEEFVEIKGTIEPIIVAEVAVVEEEDVEEEAVIEEPIMEEVVIMEEEAAPAAEEGIIFSSDSFSHSRRPRKTRCCC
jgi:hypothetical protein